MQWLPRGGFGVVEAKFGQPGVKIRAIVLSWRCCVANAKVTVLLDFLESKHKNNLFISVS